MKALVLREHGGLENLKVVHDHPMPVAKEGWVVIRVRASSFNYHDVFTVKGMPGIKVPLPVVIGLDMAGDIHEVGAGVTGWKVGYVAAPASMTAEFRKVHQFNAFVSNSPVQYAFADFMKNKDAYLSLPAFYQRKRDLFLECLKGSRFKPLPSRGTFFQNLAYDAISDEKDYDLAIRLTREKGVASIPVSVFYREPPAHKVLRFCFAKSDETLAKGAEILRKL